MKFTIDVDCTPAEARAFFGLPDVAPMQEKMMKELETQMMDNLKSMDPETLVKTWLPATVQGWGEIQKMFWDQMGGMAGMQTGKSPSSGSKSKS